MKFRKNRINKNSERKVLHKINPNLINKNPNVEKEHIITKIKKHERLYTFYLSCFFLFIILGITFIIGTSFKHFLFINSYKSGNLIVEYSPKTNGIGDIVTLTDSNIIDDGKIKNDENYKFTIKNNSFSKVKYIISIRIDDDFIKLDQCQDKLFNNNSIKYNINKGKINYLTNKIGDNRYLIQEDIIPGKSTKLYSLNIWLDKNTKFENKHFHGVIEVDMKKA